MCKLRREEKRQRSEHQAGVSRQHEPNVFARMTEKDGYTAVNRDAEVLCDPPGPEDTTPTRGVVKQFLAGTSAALSAFIAGTWLGWSSPAIRKIVDGEVQFEVSSDQISWMVAFLEFGNTLSPIPSGYMADSLGRKNTLLLTAFLYMGTWLLAIFGTSAVFLYAARIGGGIGKGVAFTVVPMYLGEIASVPVRGALSTVFIGLLHMGILFEFCIGPFVSYEQLNIVSSIAPVIFVLTFVWFPDSPYYLLMKGRKMQARKALAWFRSAEKTDEALQQELDGMAKMVQNEMQQRGGFKDLFATSGNRKALMIVLFLSAFQRFGGISPMVAYTVITLPKTGGYFHPELYMIIFAAATVVASIATTPLMDRVGRKPLLVGSCACCALFTGISTVFYWAAGPKNDTDYNWIPYLCFIGYGITYNLGIGSIPTTFVGELFPTNIKGIASALTAISYSVASFATHKSYLFVKQTYGTHFIYGFFALCNLSSTIFSVLVVFETKGKTFLEIQDILNKK